MAGSAAGALAMAAEPLLEQWRCVKCNKLMLEYRPVAGLVIRRRCDRCGEWNDLNVKDDAA